MNLADIRDYIVQPALASLGLNQLARVQLVIGTGGTESGGYRYLDQTTPGPGPAYGFWQMERATHDDLWKNYLAYQPSAFRDQLYELSGLEASILGGYKGIPDITVLHWNLRYAAAMCGIHYRRVRAPLPEPGDYEAMARYWKQWYNTPLGKGTIVKATPYFKEACEL